MFKAHSSISEITLLIIRQTNNLSLSVSPKQKSRFVLDVSFRKQIDRVSNLLSGEKSLKRHHLHRGPFWRRPHCIEGASSHCVWSSPSPLKCGREGGGGNLARSRGLRTPRKSSHRGEKKSSGHVLLKSCALVLVWRWHVCCSLSLFEMLISPGCSFFLSRSSSSANLTDED